MEPEQFVLEILKQKLHASYVVVGTDWRFGHERKGDVTLLQSLQKKYDYEVIVIEKECCRGREISSTFVKQALAAGDMELVTRLLGRPYTLSGVVQRGKQLGRRLDFPTANLSIPEGKAIPPRGVYAARAWVRGLWMPAAVNIGTHPTAPEGAPTIEANLLDWQGGEFYGCHMRLCLFKRLREEKRFDSLEALRAEVMRNREQVRAYFAQGGGAD